MSIEKSPAFQFYPKDFLTDSHVVAMNLTELGAYITLLSICWLEQSVPADHGALARLCKVPRAKFSKLWPALKPCFTVSQDRLIQPRLERERNKQETYRSLKAQAGRQGGRPKAEPKQTQSTRKAHGNQNGSRSQTEKSPPSSSSSSSSSSDSLTGPPKEPADGRVKAFLQWFPEEYKKRRHGADYLVKWQRDAPLVKQMLGATDYERLQKLAQILLSDKTDEPFIADTDRGVQILSVKFNWLSERLAAWEASRAKVTA